MRVQRFVVLVLVGSLIAPVTCLWKGCPLVNYKCAQVCMKKLHTKGRCVGMRCECLDPVLAWAGLQVPYGGFGDASSFTGFSGLEGSIANGIGYVKKAKALLPEVGGKIVDAVKEMAQPIPTPEPPPVPKPSRKPRKMYKTIRQRPIYVPYPVMYSPPQMPKDAGHSYYPPAPPKAPQPPVYHPPKAQAPKPQPHKQPPVYHPPNPQPPQKPVYQPPKYRAPKPKIVYRKVPQHPPRLYHDYPESVVSKGQGEVTRLYARHPEPVGHPEPVHYREPVEDERSNSRPSIFEQEEQEEEAPPGDQYVEDDDPVYENEYEEDDEEEMTDRQWYYDYR